MKICNIHIENYRSIKILDVRPAEICALVGENGAGKSNILASLDFLLGDKFPMSHRLLKSDYFNHDDTLPICIGVEFEPNPANIWKVWAKFQQNEKDYCRFLRFGETPDQAKYNYLSNEIREQCALVYVGADRSIEKHLGYSSWALLGRIIRQFDADFPSEQKEALENHFNDALDLLRTDRFVQFEQELTNAFSDQLKQLNHRLKMEFRAFDPHSYYSSIQLLLRQGNQDIIVLPEAGQGMRNLVILALFRAYAKVFRGDAIIAVEEPEIYLHPHAQRTLGQLFSELATQGNQILYSTHSAHFVNVKHFDQICLVEKRPDPTGQPCTHIRQVPANKLLEVRKRLFPSATMSIDSIRQRYHDVCGLEHDEAFFARKIVLVEGDTEQQAFPIYSHTLDYDFDAHGVSIVNARGKTNIDQFYQLYKAFGIPVYTIFDNDLGKQHPDPTELNWNEILLRMLERPARPDPSPTVQNTYAILDNTFETEMRKFLGEADYESLAAAARQELGKSAGKGLVARHMARELTSRGQIPKFIQQIIDAIKALKENTKDGPDDIPF